MRLIATVAASAALGLMFSFSPTTSQADGAGPFSFTLVPASASIASCLPDATATVTVVPVSETRGTDTLVFRASGLRPNTDFVLFLTEMPVPPFGAVQYIGDYTTDSQGKGGVVVNAIILEAFSSQLVSNCDTLAVVRQRKELNH